MDQEKLDGEKNENENKEQEEKLDFSAFDNVNQYFKIEPNSRAKLRFKSAKNSTATFKETNPDGTEKITTTPSMDFLTETINGEKIEKTFSVTSGYLIKTLGEYHDKKALFTHIFDIKREGSGKNTKYFVFDEGPKPTE